MSNLYPCSKELSCGVKVVSCRAFLDSCQMSIVHFRFLSIPVANRKDQQDLVAKDSTLDSKTITSQLYCEVNFKWQRSSWKKTLGYLLYIVCFYLSFIVSHVTWGSHSVTISYFCWSFGHQFFIITGIVADL